MRSMTGYGQGSGADDRYRVSVSLRSVNSRYLDLVVRLKEEHKVYEPQVRQLLEEELRRGRVDATIEQSIACLAKRGTYVLVGAAGGGHAGALYQAMAPKAAELYSFQGPTIADTKAVLSLAEQGELDNRVELFPFEEKAIRAAYESGLKDHFSPVQNMQSSVDHLILQGVENGRGWDIAINTKTGRMSASGVGDAVSFLAFGACTSL